MLAGDGDQLSQRVPAQEAAPRLARCVDAALKSFSPRLAPHTQRMGGCEDLTPLSPGHVVCRQVPRERLAIGTTEALPAIGKPHPNYPV